MSGDGGVWSGVGAGGLASVMGGREIGVLVVGGAYGEGQDHQQGLKNLKNVFATKIYRDFFSWRS